MNQPFRLPTDTLDPLLDPVLLAEAKAMLQEKFPRVIGYFLEDSARYISEIEAGLVAGQIDAVVPPAHTLKSSAWQIGACRLSNRAKAIELEAKEVLKTGSDRSALISSAQDIRVIFDLTCKALSALSSVPSAS